MTNKSKVDYVAALHNPDAPELEPRKNHVPLETGKESVPASRGAGRPPSDGESATHHIHLRVTKRRKNCWVGAAYPKTLAQWMTENLDKASHYESSQQ